MTMYFSPTIDFHVHSLFHKHGTRDMINGAVKKGVSFIVFAYHRYTDRFNEFLDNPAMPAGYLVEGLGEKGRESVAKVKRVREVKLYAIKGQQIATKHGDVVGFPIKQEIKDSRNRSLETVCNELKDQKARIILTQPEDGCLKYAGEMMKKRMIDGVEYIRLPELFVKGKNKNAKQLTEEFKEYNVPLVAGRDARLPGGIGHCTTLSKFDQNRFNNFSNPEEIISCIFDELRARRFSIRKKPCKTTYFAVEYVSHFLSSLKYDPRDTLTQFGLSRLRELKGHFPTLYFKNHKQ